MRKFTLVLAILALDAGWAIAKEILIDKPRAASGMAVRVSAA